MEAWASLNRMLRSSFVNSFVNSGANSWWGRGSGGGDIALPSAAEHESAAAALHHVAVDLRPEGDEVISGGNQRQHHHEPDGQPRDPVNGENVRAVDVPFFPAMVEDDGHHGDALHQHLELAEIAGFNGKAFRCGDGTQAADQKFTADDDDGNPCGDQAGVELHESDECGGDEEFIGQGIEQHSHGGDLTAPAGEVAVNAISNGGCNKECGCQKFFFATGALKAVRGKN